MAKPQKRSSVRIDFHPSVNDLDEETKATLRKLTLRGGLMRAVLTWEGSKQACIPVCIAIERTTIVGWACLDNRLISVYVLPKQRRCGIGSQLVRAIYSLGRSRKKVLQARAHSKAGERLFLKMQQELPLYVNSNYTIPTRIAPFR